MNWDTVLNELDRTHPFLKKLSVSLGEGLSGVKIPPIIKTSTSVAIRMIEGNNDSRRAAIVFPKITDCAKWAATGAALSVMQDDFVINYERLPELRAGDRLALDRPNCIVEYAGEDHTGFLILKLDGGATYKRPSRQRIRLQPTSSNRPLASRPPKLKNPPVIDEILDIGTLGNRSFFKSSVILVSSIIKTRVWAQHTFASIHSHKPEQYSVPMKLRAASCAVSVAS